MSVINYTIGSLGGYPVNYLNGLDYGLSLTRDVSFDVYGNVVYDSYNATLGSVYPVGMTELIEAVQTTNILNCLLITFVFVLTMIVLYNVMMQRFKFNR